MTTFRWTPLIILVSAALAYLGLDAAPEEIPPTGMIRLEILPSACANVSPQMREQAGQSLDGLNDGELDLLEAAALGVACPLRAVAIAPNGMRLTDVPLLLLRQEVLSGATELVGGSRSTDAYGGVTWLLDLAPNTHFAYYVVSPSPTKQAVRSNVIEIQLCTGDPVCDRQ